MASKSGISHKLNGSSNCKQSWNNLIDIEPKLFKGDGSRVYALITEVEVPEKLTVEEVTEFVQIETQDAFARALRVMDGFLVITSQKKSQELIYLKSVKIGNTKVIVNKKLVPPIDENGFIVEGFSKQKDELRKYLMGLEKQMYRVTGKSSPSVQPCCNSSSFFVLYEREAEITLIKDSIKTFQEKQLKVKSLCERDCIRIGDLPEDVCAKDVTQALLKVERCRITHVDLRAHVALVYFVDCRDANYMYQKINKSGLTVKGSKVSSSLKHHYTPLVLNEGTTSTQKRGTADQGGKKKHIDSSSIALPNSPESSRRKQERAHNNGHTTRGSNTLSETEQNSSTSRRDVMEFHPDVSYDVMDYVCQTPELTQQLADKLGCDVNLKKKSTTTVDGYSMFYAIEVKKKKSLQKELPEKTVKNTIDQFFDQFDSKSQKFDVYSLKEKRIEMGWDVGNETLVQMEIKKGEMCQALIRWDDIEKGNVTVTGNKYNIDDILNKLKLATARSVPSTSKHTPLTSKYRSGYSQPVPSQHTSEKNTKPRNCIELSPSLVQWFNHFGGSDPSCGIALKNVTLDVTVDGKEISLKGKDQEVMRAKHLIEELSPQLKTRFHKVESEKDLEYLNSAKGKKFIRKIELGNHCAIAVHSQDTKGSKPIEQIPSNRKKPVTLAEGRLNRLDVIVSVVRTDITEFHCDAIVNASNEDLQLLHAGISGSILKKGGPSIQTEMDQIYYRNGRLITGQAVTTGAGKLPCKKIIHAVGPRWGSSSNSANELSTCVTSILLQAEVYNLSSIAIPAISSGVFGGDVATCTSLLVKAVHHYLDRNESCIKEVAFVEMTDSYTLEMFQKELRKVSTPRKLATGSQNSSGSGNTSRSGTQHKQAAITRQPSGGHKSSANIGPITVVVKQGDLSQDDSDVIVNPTNQEYQLHYGMVSKVILSRGGKKIQQEVRSWKKNLSFDSFRTSGSGNLPCKKIVHLPIPFESNRWISLLEEVYCKVANDGYRSIALPAIGTGNLKKTTRHSAALIRTSIEKFVSSNKTKSLTEIRVVIFDRSILKEFAEVLLSDDQLKRIENKTLKVEQLSSERNSVSFADPQSPGITLCAMDDEILDRTWLLIKSKMEAIRSEPQIVTDDQVILPQLNDNLDELFQVEDDCKVSIEIVTNRKETRVKITGSLQNVSLAKEKCQELVELWVVMKKSKSDVEPVQAAQTQDTSTQTEHDQRTDDLSNLDVSPPEPHSINDRDAKQQSSKYSDASDSSTENEEHPARQDQDEPSSEKEVPRKPPIAITKEKIVPEPGHKVADAHQTPSPRKLSGSDKSNDDEEFHDASESPFSEANDPDHSRARNPQRQGSVDRPERGESSRKHSGSEDQGVKATDLPGRSNPNDEAGTCSSSIASAEGEAKSREVAKSKMSLAANFPASGSSKRVFTDEDWNKWRELDTDEWRIDTLDKDSQRYKKFAKKLQNIPVEIIEIQRIRNPALHKKFREAAGSSRKSNCMFFGVGQFDKVEEICKRGWIAEGNAWTIFHPQPKDAAENAAIGNMGERKLFIADVYSPTSETSSPQSVQLRESYYAYPLALVTFKSGSEEFL